MNYIVRVGENKPPMFGFYLDLEELHQLKNLCKLATGNLQNNYTTDYDAIYLAHKINNHITGLFELKKPADESERY